MKTRRTGKRTAPPPGRRPAAGERVAPPALHVPLAWDEEREHALAAVVRPWAPSADPPAVGRAVPTRPPPAAPHVQLTLERPAGLPPGRPLVTVGLAIPQLPPAAPEPARPMARAAALPALRQMLPPRPVFRLVSDIDWDAWRHDILAPATEPAAIDDVDQDIVEQDDVEQDAGGIDWDGERRGIVDAVWPAIADARPPVPVRPLVPRPTPAVPRPDAEWDQWGRRIVASVWPSVPPARSRRRDGLRDSIVESVWPSARSPRA